jgi:hypothetical protein
MQRLEEQAKEQHINFTVVGGDAVGFINGLTKMAEDRNRRMSSAGKPHGEFDKFMAGLPTAQFGAGAQFQSIPSYDF